MPVSQTDRKITLARSNDCPIDASRLAMVADNEEERKMILTLFFRLAEDTLETMAQARDSKDQLNWQRASHNLRGSAANLGMKGLMQKCEDAEKNSDMSFEILDNMLHDIHDEIEHIRAYEA